MQQSGLLKPKVTLLPKRCRCGGWESHWETMAYVNCFSVNVMCVYKGHHLQVTCWILRLFGCQVFSKELEETAFRSFAYQRSMRGGC